MLLHLSESYPIIHVFNYILILFHHLPDNLLSANDFLPQIAKNGVYITLVRDVRSAFEGSALVKIDCRGMHASDYKKLGAKLKVGIYFFATASFLHLLMLHNSPPAKQKTPKN